MRPAYKAPSNGPLQRHRRIQRSN